MKAMQWYDTGRPVTAVALLFLMEWKLSVWEWSIGAAVRTMPFLYAHNSDVQNILTEWEKEVMMVKEHLFGIMNC